MVYEEYLQSPRWRNEVRAAALERAGYKCQVCGRDDATLNVHHNTYERLGHEALTDLVVLCQNCHDLFHAQESPRAQNRHRYTEGSYGAYVEEPR